MSLRTPRNVHFRASWSQGLLFWVAPPGAQIPVTPRTPAPPPTHHLIWRHWGPKTGLVPWAMLVPGGHARPWGRWPMVQATSAGGASPERTRWCAAGKEGMPPYRLWVKNRYPIWNPGKWRQEQKRRSPDGLMLTHTHMGSFRESGFIPTFPTEHQQEESCSLICSCLAAARLPTRRKMHQKGY